jgi:hypothetical protein
MVAIPELGIKDSKLAERVIKILQTVDNRFDLALQLVEIADEHIRSQTARDTVEIAIEMARTPNFKLSEGKWRRIRHLLLSARSELQGLSEGEASTGRLLAKVDWILARLPWPPEDMVYGKLSGNPAPDRPLTPYSLRIETRTCLRLLNEIVAENGSNRRELTSIGRIRKSLTAVLEIAGGKARTYPCDELKAVR